MDGQCYGAAERTAGSALLVRYERLVRRVLSKSLGSDPDLEEMVHDVILLAVRRVDGLGSPAALPSWLMTTAAFTARARVRSRRQQRNVQALLAQQYGSAQPDDFDAREAMRAVYRVLDSLRPNSQTAFKMRYLEGMTLREIADACQVSIPTIKRRLDTARRHFVLQARAEPALRRRLTPAEGYRTVCGTRVRRAAS